MADPNQYNVVSQVAAKTPSVGGNEPKSSHNPPPKAAADKAPGFNSVGRC